MQNKSITDSHHCNIEESLTADNHNFFIKTCDQAGCVIDKLTKENGNVLLTCSCSKKKYRYKFVFDKKSFPYRTNLCDENETHDNQHENVIYLGNERRQALIYLILEAYIITACIITRLCDYKTTLYEGVAKIIIFSSIINLALLSKTLQYQNNLISFLISLIQKNHLQLCSLYVSEYVKFLQSFQNVYDYHEKYLAGKNIKEKETRHSEDEESKEDDGTNSETTQEFNDSDTENEKNDKYLNTIKSARIDEPKKITEGMSLYYKLPNEVAFCFDENEKKKKKKTCVSGLAGNRNKPILLVSNITLQRKLDDDFITQDNEKNDKHPQPNLRQNSAKNDSLTTDKTAIPNRLVAKSNIKKITKIHANTDNTSSGIFNSYLLESHKNDQELNSDRFGKKFPGWSVDNYFNLKDNIVGSAKHHQYIGMKNRLASFIGWSYTHIKEPKYFAEAGFYYTGKEDIVRCFFCDIGLAEWISEDDPWVEHARYSPKCLFVLEKNGHEFIANIQAEWRQVYCPKHSEFEELDARIRSFKNCPSSIKQKTEQLASAGFYYTGKDDTVKCHFCDGGLRGFEESDEPWTEHAKWFPYCKFLVKMKGQAYVKEIAKRQSNNNSLSSSNQTGKDNKSKAESRKNAETPDDSIDSKATKKLLKMSVSGQKVIDAINEHTRKTGFRIFTIEELLNIILRSDANPDPESNFAITTERANMEPQVIQALMWKKENMYKETMLCVQCKSAERCIMFYPCGHRLVCKSCSKTLKQCLKCKRNIKKCHKTYLS